MNYLLLLLVGEIVLIFSSYVFTGKKVIVPSVLFCGMFFISTLCAFSNQERWNIQFSSKSCMILLTGMLVFVLVDLMFNASTKKYDNMVPTNLAKPIVVDDNLLLLFDLLVIIGITLYYTNIASITGQSGFTALTTYRRIQVSNVNLDQSTNIVITFLNRFIRAGVYVSLYFFIRNLVLKNNDKYDKMINRRLLFPLIYIIAMCFFNSSRGELIKVITFAFAASYIASSEKSYWQRNLGMKYIARGLVVVIVFVPSFYLLAVLMQRTPAETMYDYLTGYVGGSIEFFNMFINSGTTVSDGMFEAFSGIQSLLLRLHLISMKQSTHLEFRWLSNIVHGNVYTFFRRPYHDFGLFGMYVFTFCVALLLSSIFYKKIRGKYFSYHTGFIMILYCYLLPWVTMGSIEQLSVSYISIGSFVEMFFLYVWFKLFLKVRITFNGR